ncbi:MAG: serine hydrolase [Candidatus Latescibacteria bacterium]|nr:serine hydrolase [Candidatus Latescibacterota bacterium]
MKRRYYLICLALLALWGPSRAAAQERPDLAAIKAILEERIDTLRRGVGIVVGVIDADGRAIVGHGRPSLTSDEEVDGDTAFEIGSITKVFTSVLLADMAARGELAIDDPIADFLPDWIAVPGNPGRPITLRDLAIHRSGLPRMPANFAPADQSNPFVDYTEEQMYQFLDGYDLPRDVGAQYEYSNLGVGLLGHALAFRAGMDFESLVINRIAAPLDLADTRIGLGPDLRARLAPGHDLGGQPVPNWDIPSLAGAGALRSTTNDLLDFLAANMGLQQTPLAAAFDSTHVAQASAGSGNMDIGLGWHILKGPGYLIHWHNGGTGGYRTFAGFRQDLQLGIVVLSNTANDVTDIGFHLFDPQFPLAQLEAIPEVVEVDPALLDEYVGEYELAPDFVLTVTREGERFYGQATGQDKFALFAASETHFFLSLIEARVTFVKDESGAVTHLVLHQGGADLEAIKRPSPTAVLAGDSGALPEEYGLDNYPNPFNPRTQIRFALPRAGVVGLDVFDVQGQKVATVIADQYRVAGWHAVEFNATGLAAGAYFYRLRSGDTTRVGKMMLLK